MAVATSAATTRVGVDIGGTFTDVVLEIGDALHRANWWWVGAAAVLSLVSVPLLAERWRAALGMLGETMPLDVAVRLHYGDVAHTVETDPLVAARRVAGAEVHIVASYTQFTRLTKEFW